MSEFCVNCEVTAKERDSLKLDLAGKHDTLHALNKTLRAVMDERDKLKAELEKVHKEASKG